MFLDIIYIYEAKEDQIYFKNTVRKGEFIILPESF